MGRLLLWSLFIISTQRSRRLLDVTVQLPGRCVRRFLSPLISAWAVVAARCATQAERGLICISSLSVLEVLLRQTRIRLKEVVSADLRVEGMRVMAQDLLRRNEALGSVTELACGSSHGEEAALFAVLTQPAQLRYQSERQPCPTQENDYYDTRDQDEGAYGNHLS